jgi:hypothetical protein
VLGVVEIQAKVCRYNDQIDTIEYHYIAYLMIYEFAYDPRDISDNYRNDKYRAFALG